MRVGHPDIAFDVDLPGGAADRRASTRRLMAQALTNVVKNATEAIAAVPPGERGAGRIAVIGRARATDRSSST